MPYSPSVKIRGLTETIRAFDHMSGTLRGEIRDGLASIGEIVRQDELGYLNRIGASRKSMSGIKVSVRQRGVTVYQRYRTVTGKRPDWGARIFSSLYHAAKTREPEVEAALERLLDQLTAEEGF